MINDAPQATWVNLKSGGRVLKLWETIGPADPQIALLQLSDAQYRAFAKDRVGFLNSNNVFPVKVNQLFDNSTLTLNERDTTGSDNWMVMIEHEWTSNVATAAMLLFAPQPKGAY